jgi:hypothetical protein
LKSSFTPPANPLKTRGFGKGIQARSAQLPQANPLQTRPFGSPIPASAQQEETESASEPLEKASHFGYNGLDVPVNAPGTPSSPVSRKLSRDRLEDQYQPQAVERVNPVLNGLYQLKVQRLTEAQNEVPLKEEEQQEQPEAGMIQRLCSECASELADKEDKQLVQTQINLHRAKPLVQRLTAEEKELNLKSPRFAGNPRLEAVYDNSPAMRKGEQGDAVKRVQQALIDDGLAMPISTRKTGEPDGIFGDETYNAVLQFQIKHQLGKDGVVGRQTLGKLDELFSTSPTTPETSTQELPPCPINMQPDTGEKALMGASFAPVATNNAILSLPGVNCQIQGIQPQAKVTNSVKLMPIKKNAKACLVHLHGDETNALMVAKDNYRDRCTNLTFIDNPGERNINIEVTASQIQRPVTCHADPNRIFDNTAIRSQWNAWNNGSCKNNKSIKEAAQKAVDNYRDKELLPKINQCQNKSSSQEEVNDQVNKGLPVVAFHNNTPGGNLSINSYNPGGSEYKATEKNKNRTKGLNNPHIVKGQDPDNFMLVTDSNHFQNLVKMNRNVVLQAQNISNDGSLSVFLQNGEYVNVEAQRTRLGKPNVDEFIENSIMGDDALDVLKVPSACP